MDCDEMIPKTPKLYPPSDPVDSYHTFSKQFSYSESLSDIKMKNIEEQSSESHDLNERNAIPSFLLQLVFYKYGKNASSIDMNINEDVAEEKYIDEPTQESAVLYESNTD